VGRKEGNTLAGRRAKKGGPAVNIKNASRPVRRGRWVGPLKIPDHPCRLYEPSFLYQKQAGVPSPFSGRPRFCFSLAAGSPPNKPSPHVVRALWTFLISTPLLSRGESRSLWWKAFQAKRQTIHVFPSKAKTPNQEDVYFRNLLGQD